MTFLTEILLVLRDVMVALVTSGTRSCRYETSIFIRAPRATVWRLLRSRDITFDGRFYQIRSMREQGQSADIERHRVTFGQSQLVLMLRVVAERPEVALQYELLEEGSSPEVIAGSDDFITYVLHEHRGGTQLDVVRELIPRRLISRVLVPSGLRSGIRRYKAKAEQMAAEQDRG